MRVAALLLVSALGFGCGAESSQPERENGPAPGAATTEDDGASQVVWRDADRGFTLAHPHGWRRAASPLTPHLSDPRELLALGTYELRPGGDRCAHQPVHAIEDLGPRDALIVVFERAPPYAEVSYPPRPAEPQLTSGSNRFCVPHPARRDSWIAFGERGRAFYALLALGAEASAETRAQLLAVYASITFDESGGNS